MDTLVGLAPQNVGYNGHVWFGALKRPVWILRWFWESLSEESSRPLTLLLEKLSEKWLLSRSCHRTWICWVGYFFTDSLDSAPFKGEDFGVTFSFCIEQAHHKLFLLTHADVWGWGDWFQPTAPTSKICEFQVFLWCAHGRCFRCGDWALTIRKAGWETSPKWWAVV